MNERELGKALLKFDAADLSGISEARQQTMKILHRDKRRVRLLAALTIIFWLLAAGLVYAFLFSFFSLYADLVPKAGGHDTGPQLKPAEDVLVPPGNVGPDQLTVLVRAVYKFLLVISASVEALVFAALFTILLVFASRRALLRQINASLVEISEQLKQLRTPPTV